MAVSPENPFANYQPPALDEIFTPEFKAEMQTEKLAYLSELVRTNLAIEERAKRFVDGSLRLVFIYGLDRLEPFVAPNEDTLELVMHAATNGLVEALEEQGLDIGENDKAVISVSLVEEKPEMIKVMAFVEDDNSVT